MKTSVEEFVHDIRNTEFKEHFRKIAEQARLEREVKLKKCRNGNHQGTMECTGFAGGRIYFRCSLCKMTESEYDRPFDI